MTSVSFGSVSLVANQVPVFVPDANGQNLPPGLNFNTVTVHVGVTQVPDGCYLKWDVDWSTETGNSTVWNHTGGIGGFLPSFHKDGSLSTEQSGIFGIPAGVRRGRLHVTDVSMDSTISVSVDIV